MPLRFFCPRWGFEHVPWPTFLRRVKEAGYDGIEWYPYGETADVGQVAQWLDEYELDLTIVMTVRNAPADFNAYLTVLSEQLADLATVGGKRLLHLSAQTGREYFSSDQVEDCLAICEIVSTRTGIPIYQETHRNKWTYAAHVVAPFLKKYASLPLTLDISHWFCVSESYLEDQAETVELAVRQARHLHARVGHTQGPQVWDPAADEYAEALQAHLAVWDRYVALRREQRAAAITITPEFGPPPYMVKGHKTVPDDEHQFTLNRWMKDFLTQRYSP
ncbi:hypothetical protein GCM10027347_29850 [Larkinella harenae]